MLKKIILIFVFISYTVHAEFCYECDIKYFINKSNKIIDVYSGDGGLKFLEGISIHENSGFFFRSFAEKLYTGCIIIESTNEKQKKTFFVSANSIVVEEIKKYNLLAYYIIYNGETITVWDAPNNGKQLDFEIRNSCPEDWVI